MVRMTLRYYFLLLLKKLTERVRVIGSSDPAAFMSHSTVLRRHEVAFPPSFPFSGGLLQRAMSPIVDEVSCIRPIASTYNVVITFIIPSIYSVVQRTVAPPTRKGRNIGTSLPFGSENLWGKLGFKFPRTTRLYSQGEYAAPRIIPSAANVATKLLIWKAPTKMGNSPIKLLVPGKLILAKVEENKMVGGFGMVLTEPP